MIESDIRGNSDAECEMPICRGTECETHHPECTCDNCCQPTDSFCETLGGNAVELINR